MAKNYNISDTSKIKMIMAYDLYKIDKDYANNERLVVQYSYKQDDYNVYAFSDCFHIGLNIDGDEIYEKYISPAPKSDREKYEMFETAIISRNETLANQSINEVKFRNINSMIHAAIHEYINRDYVYSQYEKVKKDQINLIKTGLLQRIENEMKIIKRIQSRKLTFLFDNGEGIETPFDLQIGIDVHEADRRGQTVFEWFIAKTPENLTTVLSKSLQAARGDELLAAMFRYLVLIYYYQPSNAFNKLFSNTRYSGESVDVSREVGRIFEVKQFNGDILCNIVDEAYKVNLGGDGVNVSEFDYNLITNVGHLDAIHAIFDILVDGHKQYVPAKTKEIEQRFFGLNYPLAGSKDTKLVLSRVMRLDVLLNRINSLTNPGSPEIVATPEIITTPAPTAAQSTWITTSTTNYTYSPDDLDELFRNV